MEKRERTANAKAAQWMNKLDVWCWKIAKSDQVIAIAPARSPSGDEKEYATEVDSRKKRARKTKTLVKIPALWVLALTPKASKAVRRTKTVVQP